MSRQIKGLPMRIFDDLEAAIDDLNISRENVILGFRDFLVGLDEWNRFRNLSQEELEPLRRYLDRGTVLRSFVDESLREKLAGELAVLAEENKDHADRYNLIRCLRFIFVKQSDWEDVAQDMPIFYFFSCLRKIFFDIEAELVDFFVRKLAIPKN